MIDYDKLKIGQKIFVIRRNKITDDCAEFEISTEYVTKLEHKSEPYDGLFYCTKSKYCDLNIERRRQDIYLSLNDALQAIKNLTQDKPKPKYKDAWYVQDGKIFKTVVRNQDGYVFGEFTDVSALGRTMYPSKQALIESQIEYWASLKNEEISTKSEDIRKHCVHKFDGKFYHAFTKDPCDIRNTMHFVCKCADCGEWYT